MKHYGHFGDGEQMHAKRAIVLYQSTTSSLATIHDVDTDPAGKLMICAGELLTREALDSLVIQLNDASAMRSVLPANVLAFEGGRMVWWYPASYQPILFNSADNEFNTEVSGKSVHHPALVFMAEPKRLSAMALAINERPGPSTPLFRAPYFNVYAKGNMCSGSVLLPSILSPAEIPVWEEAFFRTNFTHSNVHGEPLTTYKGGHNALWRAMVTARSFPIKSLVPMQITLERFINS